MDLSSLDPKHTLTFCHADLPPLPSPAVWEQVSSCTAPHHAVYRVRGLLRPTECEAVLRGAGNTFQRLPHRSRLLGFESNEVILRAMESRLAEGMPADVRHGSVPYGFGTDQMVWETTGVLNPCLRITRYESETNDHFPPHRDAQYTEAFHIKSSHTLLVYLNSDFDGGETVLGDHGIRPVQGDALVFDQRWAHAGNPSFNGSPKFVLRSDLVSRSNSPRPSLSDVEERMHTLTARLFRQAQYHELEGDGVSAGKLYTLVIDLRCGAIPRDVYPIELESLLTPIPVGNVPVTGTNLECVSRTGHSSLYRYSPHTGDLGTCREYIRVAIVHSLAHSTRRMVKEALPFPRSLTVAVTEGPEIARDATLHDQGVVDALCTLCPAVSRGDVEWMVDVWKAGMRRYDEGDESSWRAVVDAYLHEFDSLKSIYGYRIHHGNRHSDQNYLWDNMFVSDVVRPRPYIVAALSLMSAVPRHVQRDVLDVIVNMIVYREAGYVVPFPVLFEYIVSMNLQSAVPVFPSDVVRHIQGFLNPNTYTPGDVVSASGTVLGLDSYSRPTYSTQRLWKCNNYCVPHPTPHIPACVSVRYTEAKCMFTNEGSGCICRRKDGCCDDAWDMWDSLGEEHTGPLNPYLAMSPWGDAVVHLTFGMSHHTTVLCGTASLWCGTASFNHASCQGMRIKLESYCYEEEASEVEGTPVLMATRFRLDMGRCEIVVEQEPSVVI